MYARQLDGFGQEQPQPSAESPAFHSETVAVYPGDKNNLPYDVVVERLHIEEPEPPAPVTEPEKTFEEVLDEHPVSIQVNGQWQTFPNAKAAEEASYEEYKANLRRNAQNFRITDEHLGEGGPKAKFQANIEAIKLLKYLEDVYKRQPMRTLPSWSCTRILTSKQHNRRDGAVSYTHLADTDGYFSADHQKIAIRQGMSEVQTVSATVHEIAHSKLHDPKKYEMLPSWKVVQESEGGTKHDFKLDFATEKEAEQFASDMDWRYVDENQFEWRLAVEEDATAKKQAIKNRHTEEVEAESISYACLLYTSRCV